MSAIGFPVGMAPITGSRRSAIGELRQRFSGDGDCDPSDVWRAGRRGPDLPGKAASPYEAVAAADNGLSAGRISGI